MLSISDLFTTPTADEVFEKFLDELETLGVGARSWRQGGVARTMLRVVAGSYAGFASVQRLAIRSMYLETAEAGWLTVLARNVYGVARVEATFATGQVTLTNPGGGIYNGVQARTIQVRNPGTGKVYTNVAGFSLGAGSSVTIDVEALEQGSASSAAPGAVSQMVTTLGSTTCTNASAIVGLDQESDAALRTACRNRLAAISVRGPRGAYAHAVRVAAVAGVPVNVNRVQVSASSSVGAVNVYVASASGVPSSGELTAIAASIEDIARPDSVTANVYAATPVPVTRDLVVWARRVDGVDEAAIKAAVESALVAASATYPVGGIPKPPNTQGYLYADFLAGTAKGAHASIYDVDGAGADIALAPGEVAVLSTTVAVRIVEVG